jgi:hypothetical protein
MWRTIHVNVRSDFDERPDCQSDSVLRIRLAGGSYIQMYAEEPGSLKIVGATAGRGRQSFCEALYVIKNRIWRCWLAASTIAKNTYVTFQHITTTHKYCKTGQGLLVLCKGTQPSFVSAAPWMSAPRHRPEPHLGFEGRYQTRLATFVRPARNHLVLRWLAPQGIPCRCIWHRQLIAPKTCLTDDNSII